MEQLEEHLSTVEKELVDCHESNDDHHDSQTETEDNANRSTGMMATFQEIDGKFKRVLNKLTDKMWHARQSVDPAAAVQFKQYLQTNREMWETEKITMDAPFYTMLHRMVIIPLCRP